MDSFVVALARGFAMVTEKNDKEFQLALAKGFNITNAKIGG